MIETAKEPPVQSGGDLVLQEIWRIKNEVSAARGHDVHRLFADARERQKLSGHPVVNLQTKQRKA
ncbi:MAG: hypothetical protein ABIV39_10060 [Verrucomicrobiota bacterium]